MPYLFIDNFAAGLDTRRHVLNSRDGTLAVLKNAHITRGGEIEKRKAFVSYASLPANTFGLETTADNVYVFGSIATPAMPSGITYQRLQHPDGLAMTKVVHSTVYGGLPFVIAEYAGGDRRCFWDGSIVRDWFIGVATSAMGTLANFAESLKLDFSFSGYSCTRSGSILSITGPIGRDFDVASSATSPMTAVVNKVQSSTQPVVGKIAEGSFVISAGSESPAEIRTDLRFINVNTLPDITGIYINGVEILGLSPGSVLRYDTITPPGSWDNGPRLAYTIYTLINANSANSGYTSKHDNDAYSGSDVGQFWIYADSALGSSANGWSVEFEFAADPSSVYQVNELIMTGTIVASPYNATRFVADMKNQGPTHGELCLGAYSGVTSVKVDGVEIMGETVPWKSSNSETAVNIVNAINAYTSSPEFTVDTESGKITIAALTSGTSQNGKTISVTTQGDTVASAVTTLTGGTNDVAGTSQISSVTLGGTFTVGGTVSVTVTDATIANPYIFGASRVAGKLPAFSTTYKGKEYAAVGSTMYFSALNDATKWDIYDLGSGFIDMSNNFGGREDLTGFGVYQDKLAVFGRRNVQLWFLDVDPAQNQQLLVLSNTGSLAPDSVVSMGSIDVMYLSDSGIRSLRARDSTDTAFANDIGSPIDSVVISQMSGMTEDQKYLAKGLIEPIDGRYWLCLGDKIYVLSYFPGANVSAWSTYETGFSVDDVAVQSPRVFVRSGNTIYLYGGTDGNTYDSSEVVAELPYLDAKKPATYKRAKGVDLTVEGQWKIYMGFDHTNQSARDLIATILQPTFALGKIDAVGIGTHFGVRLVNSSAGAAKLANIIVHYDELQAKHEAG